MSRHTFVPMAFCKPYSPDTHPKCVPGTLMQAIRELAPDRGVFRAIHEAQAHLAGRGQLGEFVERYVNAHLLETSKDGTLTQQDKADVLLQCIAFGSGASDELDILDEGPRNLSCRETQIVARKFFVRAMTPRKNIAKDFCDDEDSFQDEAGPDFESSVLAQTRAGGPHEPKTAQLKYNAVYEDLASMIFAGLPAKSLKRSRE